MNIALAPELQKWVDNRVESGLYSSSNEVIQEALRLMLRFEQNQISRLEQLKAQLDLGLQSAEAGRVSVSNADLVAEMKLLGRKRRT